MRPFFHFCIFLLYTINSIYSQSFQKQFNRNVAGPLVLSNGDIGIATSQYDLHDSTGVEKWSVNTNGHYGIRTAQESKNKSLLLCGVSYTLPGITTGAFVVVKKDSIGNTIWSKAFSDTSFYCRDIDGSIACEDGLIFYGLISTHTPIMQYQKIICRVDSTGNLLWGKLLIINGTADLMNGILTSDNELVFTNGYDFFKMDLNGSFIWVKQFPLTAGVGCVNICQSPNGFYSILTYIDTGFGIINMDTSGNVINAKNYFLTNMPSALIATVSDLLYLSDSTLEIFCSSMINPSPICEYTFFHLDKLQNPISASHFGISVNCNDSYKLKKSGNGFVATGNEPFDDYGHIIKVEDPYQIDCSNTFQFASDTFSISTLTSVITSSNAFHESSFIDSSTLSMLFPKGFCGTTDVSTLETPTISVFPNPFNEVVTVAGSFNDKTEIIIHDILGRRIYPEIKYSENECFLNFKSITSGIYVIGIISEDIQLSKKVIKH